MFSDVSHRYRSCCDCAMRKSSRNRHKAPLLPIPVQDAFDRVACDIIGPFPVSKAGNRYVVVFSEYLTKWVECVPVPSIEASMIARLLVDEIFCRHGAPRTLLSDRGSNFLSSLVSEVCKLLNTKEVNTTAYHPQTDGLVERFNNTLLKLSRRFLVQTNRTGMFISPQSTLLIALHRALLLATAHFICFMGANLICNLM